MVVHLYIVSQNNDNVAAKARKTHPCEWSMEDWETYTEGNYRNILSQCGLDYRDNNIGD